jgi:hypothetical protein
VIVPRINWIVFPIAMVCMFVSGAFCVPHVAAHPWLITIPMVFFILVFASSVGWLLFNLIRTHWIRRTGMTTTGRVIHARRNGSFNNVPSWEIEAELPDGSTTRLIVARYSPFTPGEPLRLIVNPRYPKHAVLPRVSYDF